MREGHKIGIADDRRCGCEYDGISNGRLWHFGIGDMVMP